MESAKEYNILLEKGATFTLEAIYEDSVGIPIDLTGWKARAQIRKSKHAADAILTFDSEEGSISLDAEGNIILEASDEETAAVTTEGQGVWDLKLIPPNGKAFRLLQGVVTISEETTKDA